MPVSILSVEQMRAWEKATWATGQTEKAVIAQVGKIIAQRALQLTRAGDFILILAGKGNNGEDARLAQHHLEERKVHLLNVIDPKSAKTELEQQLALCPALIIDGLFGIGLNRPLNEDWCALINRVNNAHRTILAVDVPSGFDADMAIERGAAIHATVTLTLGAPKHGLLSPGAAKFTGRLEVAPEIGLIPCPFNEEWQWTLPDDFTDFPPSRLVDSHKGTYGHLVIVAGSMGYHGAAVLATRAALQAAPGLVTAFVAENVYVPIAAQLQSAMVRPWSENSELPETATAIVFGPGLASPDVPASLRRTCIEWWQTSSLPVIADASALDWLPTGPVPPNSLRVVTPHPGEAARMLGITSSEVQSKRFEVVREISLKFGRSWVILKGHQTLVGRCTGPVYVNSSGNPCLARGGSGDVLAGYLGGLLAQRDLRSDPELALRYSVWRHGVVADGLGWRRPNWTIEELAAALGKVQ